MILKNYIEFLNESNDVFNLKEFLKGHGIKYDFTDEKENDFYKSYDLKLHSRKKFFKDGKFPIHFSVVKGDFDITNNELISLEGSPPSVSGTFNASSNKLSGLKGCPKRVGKHFIVASNPITSLEEFPMHVTGYVNLSLCKLTSLVGLPSEMYDDLHVEYNNLENLIGCPKSIDGSLMIRGNRTLTSLEGFPDIVTGVLDATECDNLKSLYGITHRVHKVETPKHLQVEADFINSYEMAVLKKKNYWNELLEYVLKNSKDINGVNWPDGFLPEDLRRSGSAINKYKI